MAVKGGRRNLQDHNKIIISFVIRILSGVTYSKIEGRRSGKDQNWAYNLHNPDIEVTFYKIARRRKGQDYNCAYNFHNPDSAYNFHNPDSAYNFHNPESAYNFHNPDSA